MQIFISDKLQQEFTASHKGQITKGVLVLQMVDHCVKKLKAHNLYDQNL